MTETGLTARRRARVALAAMLALASAPALAQGTRAQREACTPDAFRLCASHIPNVSAIAGCLRREEARLSPACRAAMQEAAPTVARREAPSPDLREAAPNAAPGALARRADMRPRLAAARARIAARNRARHAARHHRPRYAGLGGFGGGMREARVWIDRLGGLGGLAGLAGGAGGFDGSALAGIREMRVGDILDMMQ